MIQEEAAEVAITNNVESSKSRSGETDDNVNSRGSKASSCVPVAAKTEKTIKIIKRPSTNTRVTTADQLSAQGAKRESVLAAVPEKPITDEQLIEFEQALLAQTVMQPIANPCMKRTMNFGPKKFVGKVPNN